MKTNELAIAKKLTPLAQKAFEIHIKNQTDMSVAVEVLSQLNKFNDGMVAEKEKVTKPLNEALKAERARWKPLELMHEEAISTVREKMTTYQTEQVRIRKEEEAKIASRIKDGKGNLSLDKAVEKIEKLKTPEKEVATEEGLVQFREVKRYEIVDITKLPKWFIDRIIALAIENGLTEKVIKNHPEELPGVRYYTEQIPINYR